MLGIRLDRNSSLQLWRQLYQAMKDRMVSGQLQAGEALPSTRELAGELGISRNTVYQAYELLTAEGFIFSRQGAPTRVAEGLIMEPALPLPRKPETVYPKITVSFRTGRPELRQFPRFLWQQLLHKSADELPLAQYGYAGPQGLEALREEIASWLYRSRGLAVTMDDIFITAGATHALHLTAELLCGKGQKILMEDPCHIGMLQTFLDKGCEIIPVPVDEKGLQTELLPECGDLGAVYVTPSHQFPLGGILPASRRAALIRYVREHDAYIIEDDYDSEFRYFGEPVAPLHAMDPQRVVYVGTFSKSLFPALRVGYVILPYSLQDRWKSLRTHTDVQNPPFEQVALAELLRSRKLDRHVQKMRKLYGQRRQVLLECLEENFGHDWVAYGDAAGLHVAIDFPGRSFDEGFHRECLQQGVFITPAESHCIVKGKHLGKLLFGYGHLEAEEIRKGVQLLADILKG